MCTTPKDRSNHGRALPTVFVRSCATEPGVAKRDPDRDEAIESLPEVILDPKVIPGEYWGAAVSGNTRRSRWRGHTRHS